MHSASCKMTNPKDPDPITTSVIMNLSLLTGYCALSRSPRLRDRGRDIFVASNHAAFNISVAKASVFCPGLAGRYSHPELC